MYGCLKFQILQDIPNIIISVVNYIFFVFFVVVGFLSTSITNLEQFYRYSKWKNSGFPDIISIVVGDCICFSASCALLNTSKGKGNLSYSVNFVDWCK